MPTQIEIAAHLGIDQSTVSRQMKQLGIDWQNASMDIVRLAYLEHLRAVASGRTDENAGLLTLERIQTERAKRQNILLDLAKKSGELVSAPDLEAAFGRMVDAFRAELLSLPDKIVDELRTVYGIDVDVELINEHVIAALSELSRHEPDSPLGDSTAREAPDAAGQDDVDELVASFSAPVGEERGEGGAL